MIIDGNRISFCLAVEDDANSEIILGTNEGKYLRGHGHGILKYGRDRVEFQGYDLHERDRNKIISKYLIPKPVSYTHLRAHETDS